jgi:hypothetical protein
MSIILPKYLDDYIFKNLGGIYLTKNDVDCNLHNDNYKNRVYIGTYFPRSYAESLVIFNTLFDNAVIKNTFNDKDVINILDIGSGSGGNVIGLLDAVKSSLTGNKIFNLYTVEGNANAIECQVKIIAEYKLRSNVSINHFPLHCVFSSACTFPRQINDLLRGLPVSSFDFITTFKCLTEFYNADYQGSRGLFSAFVSNLRNYLSPEGLMAIVDVTTTDKQRTRPFTSFILAGEVNEYLRNNNTDMTYILPRSCSVYFNNCRYRDCFRQLIIEVSHSKASLDTSKICHAVFGKKPFTDRILIAKDIVNPYPVCYKKYKGPVYLSAVCNNGIPQKV